MKPRGQIPWVHMETILKGPTCSRSQADRPWAQRPTWLMSVPSTQDLSRTVLDSPGRKRERRKACFFICLFVCMFGVGTPSGAQGIFLALHSRITTGILGWPYGMLWVWFLIKPRLTTCRLWSNAFPTVLYHSSHKRHFLRSSSKDQQENFHGCFFASE